MTPIIEGGRSELARERGKVQAWRLAAVVGWIFVVVILAAEWGWIP